MIFFLKVECGQKYKELKRREEEIDREYPSASPQGKCVCYKSSQNPTHSGPLAGDYTPHAYIMSLFYLI